MRKPLFDICARDIKAYNGAMSFDNKAKAPDNSALAGRYFENSAARIQ